MTLKKYVKSRRKCKIFIIIIIIGLILLTTIVLQNDNSNNNINKNIAETYINDIEEQQQHFIGHQQERRQAIIPEKYNEHEIKTRLIKDKIKLLTQNKDDDNTNNDIDTNGPAKLVTKHIHIFYNVPVSWYKRNKFIGKNLHRFIERNTTMATTPEVLKEINIAFYPSLGLYKPQTNVFEKHFNNIKNCGIGVIIVTLGPKIPEKLFDLLINLIPKYNLSLTVEINAQHNNSIEYINEQMIWLQKYQNHDGFYKVYSIKKKSLVPIIYVRNAHKLDPDDKFLCFNQQNSLRHNFFNSLFIGHIKLKQHTENIRRLCFDGFYNRIPSNGATYSSTWKNWSYLKSFAETYKLIFVPTVGPGYAEHNKLPRHGNIQRHRSNGRYYGVAWRTAISNHIGFINVASYNNWPEGTQIEESIPKSGFHNYLPGSPMKYLDLTTHWVDNFLKTQSSKVSKNNCYEFFNNTIC